MTDTTDVASNLINIGTDIILKGGDLRMFGETPRITESIGRHIEALRALNLQLRSALRAEAQEEDA